MSKGARPASGPGPKDSLVPCRRTGRVREIPEHVACPYCFGRAEDVASGDHARFCDFRPGVDPIAFGFPETYGRYQQA